MSAMKGSVGHGIDRRVNVLGVNIDSVTLGDVLKKVGEYISDGARSTIMYANVHVVNLAQKDSALMSMLNRADLVYPDGYGVILGARLMGEALPPRMTGADWIHDLCRFALRQEYSLYIVAGESGIADTAREKLLSQYRGLSIVGARDGFFHARGETQQLVDDINEKKPHIVLVGMGTPAQERFIDHARDLIDAPVCWVVGALFDYVAGRARRGPRWMLDHGLEWLCRLAFEPTRLWKRYLVGNTVFLLRVLLRSRRSAQGDEI